MTENREKFNSRLGFILAAAGSAVGIGNLVGFPVNATKNGGGAFLVIYVLFIIFICLPVMIAEMSVGRHTEKNPLGAYKKMTNNNPFWRIGGWLSIITPFMIAVFYQVITVWILGYFLMTVSGNLNQLASPDYFGAFINGNAVFMYCALLFVIVGAVLNGGVQQGIERLAKVLMPTLIIMLVMLVLFVLTLDNAMLGVKFYLIPDFGKVTPAVVSNALNQAFFSLSLGMGILITYGSYVSRKESIANGAKLVALTDTSVAFFAGLLILPAIFAFNPATNTEELSSSSVSLVFTFLPKIFLSLEASIGYLGASIFASLFFLAVFFAALTSQVSITQVPLAALQDELAYSRTKSVLVLGLLLVLLVLACTVSFGRVPFFTEFTSYGGGVKSLFDVVYDIFYDTILPLNGFIICLFVGWRWRLANMNQELVDGDMVYQGSFYQNYVNFALRYVIPVVLLIVFIDTVAQKLTGSSLLY